MIQTSNGFIPTPDMGEQWLTVEEFARVMNCSRRHVEYLHSRCTLAAFGITVYSSPYGKRKRLYIRTPISML